MNLQKEWIKAFLDSMPKEEVKALRDQLRQQMKENPCLVYRLAVVGQLYSSEASTLKKTLILANTADAGGDNPADNQK